MALPQAGAPVTAQMLATLVNAELQTLGIAQTTATISMTTTAQDLTTAPSFTTTYANTVLMAWGVFDVDGTASNTNTFQGTLQVDGVTISGGEAHLMGGIRATVSQMWIVTIAAAGTHSLKLQGKQAAGTGILTLATHTKVHALIFGP